MSNPHPGSPGRPIPPMMRCIVCEGEKPPCSALVFVRDLQKHLEEMHTMTSSERADVGKWYVKPENPKPRKRVAAEKKLSEMAKLLGELPTSFMAVECGGDGEEPEDDDDEA